MAVCIARETRQVDGCSRPAWLSSASDLPSPLALPGDLCQHRCNLQLEADCSVFVEAGSR